MVERSGDVRAGEGKQGVGQQLVNLLRRMKHRWVRGDSEIQLEEAIVEGTPVPDARHDTDDRNEEHQDVKQVMHGKRGSAAEFANVRRQVRRLVRGSPEDPQDRQDKLDQANADMHVDPERASTPWEYRRTGGRARQGRRSIRRPSNERSPRPRCTARALAPRLVTARSLPHWKPSSSRSH